MEKERERFKKFQEIIMENSNNGELLCHLIFQEYHRVACEHF